MLTIVSSISLFWAIGRTLRRTSSTIPLTLVSLMLSLESFRSILTSVSSSVMIWFSLSTSFLISIMNSRYISTGTLSCCTRESARTFIDVIGVFSSWETLETNSCLDSSSAFILASTWLNASAMCSVSKKAGALIGSVEYPAFTAEISPDSFSKGFIRAVERTNEIRSTANIRINSRSMAFRLRIPSVFLIETVETLARRTPFTTSSPETSSADSSLSDLLSIYSVSMIGVTISIKPSRRS